MSEAFGIGAVLARLVSGRPLVIVDADEVLLRFAEGFDRFLREEGLFLDLASYRLHGNVRRLDDRTAILDVEVTALLEEFRRELDWLEPVKGARESLSDLAKSASIVVLTNIAPEQAVARTRNLAALGFDFPLVANTGLKGPAVKHLANRAAAQVWFIDDIPQHLASSAEHAPDVTRIHLVGDAQLKPLLPPSPHANLYAEDWAAASAFIQNHLNRA
jgi:FMN phosphatase YigB (HAD superfamily)